MEKNVILQKFVPHYIWMKSFHGLNSSNMLNLKNKLYKKNYQKKEPVCIPSTLKNSSSLDNFRILEKFKLRKKQIDNIKLRLRWIQEIFVSHYKYNGTNQNSKLNIIEPQITSTLGVLRTAFVREMADFDGWASVQVVCEGSPLLLLDAFSGDLRTSPETFLRLWQMLAWDLEEAFVSLLVIIYV